MELSALHDGLPAAVTAKLLAQFLWPQPGHGMTTVALYKYRAISSDHKVGNGWLILDDVQHCHPRRRDDGFPPYVLK